MTVREPDSLDPNRAAPNGRSRPQHDAAPPADERARAIAFDAEVPHDFDWTAPPPGSVASRFRRPERRTRGHLAGRPRPPACRARARRVGLEDGSTLTVDRVDLTRSARPGRAADGSKRLLT